MIVLNLIFLDVQFECDFLIKNLVKIPVYTGIYADDGIPVFAIPILFKKNTVEISFLSRNLSKCGCINELNMNCSVLQGTK